jgi:undecaprenyl-diphosphatase
VPIAVAFGFAVLGLIQWIKRKNILKVDCDILILGGFYLLVMAAYVIFEFVVINRRPVLIEGYLETSYPSSTTMLVTTVMPVAFMQLKARMKNRVARRVVSVAIVAFTVFMVLGRLISGVHWASDIIGGLLISASLVLAYNLAINFTLAEQLS